MHTIRTTLTSLAVVVLLGGLSACGAGGADDVADEPTAPAPTSESSPEEPSGEQTPSEEAPAEKVVITIEDFAFSDPGPVAAGTEITVKNLDGVLHTVTADDGEFDVDVDAGETVTFTAPSEPGDYGYICEPHPQMTATLVVE